MLLLVSSWPGETGAGPGPVISVTVRRQWLSRPAAGHLPERTADLPGGRRGDL